MTLLAAFKVLLCRHTGETDIVLGSPIAGRNQPGLDGLIGFFVNTLILRTDLSGNPTFKMLLDRVRKVALDAFAHQDLPFESIVEELQPERNEAATPYFRMMFNHLNFENVRIETPGMSVEVLEQGEPASKFDLTLYVRETRDETRLELVYNAGILGKARMAELLGQFELLLHEVAKTPEKSITEYSLVTAPARALLPDPAEPIDTAWEGSVVSHFAKQARRFPDGTAVSCKGGSWNYRELDAISNQLAHFLLSGGIERGDVVAIYGYRCRSLVWAMLGVLKAGAAFLILDSSHPVSRLISCLNVVKPKGWIEVEEAGALPVALEEFVSGEAIGCRLKLPRNTGDAANALLAGQPIGDPNIEIGPDDLAYIAFTSGSTGTPKGLLGTHAPLSHFLAWYCDSFKLDKSERFSMLSGISHDPLLRDVFIPLCLGARLCLPDPENMDEPGWLAQWMKQQQISVAHLTPAMAQLLSTPASNSDASANVSPSVDSLGHAFFGADVLTQGEVSRLRKQAPSLKCVNFYGATETPQAAGFYVISNPEQATEADYLRKRVPIGRGISDVQLLVLTASQKLAGIGEVGEIYIRTPYLTRGYLNDKQLTAERFIVNPYTGAGKDRMYKTGDLGRYLPDGNVEFLGRKDRQVKIRGFRVELREIEATLLEHAGIKQAVVVARNDSSGDKRLTAYVEPQDQPVEPSQLRLLLKARLPDYMQPSAFVTLPCIPLTPNGKVDYAALPPPDPAHEERAAIFNSPRTSIEEVVAAIWREALGIEQVGIHDNFFALGGHSLLATQVVSRAREAFRVEAPLRALFSNPTVAGFASVISEHKSMQGYEGYESELPAIVPAAHERHLPFPLTDIQQAYWVGRLGSIEMGNVASHRYLEIESAGLDLSRFNQAWQLLVDRHDMLRAVVLPDGTQQILEAVPPYKIEVTDLRGREPEEISMRLEEARRKMSHQMLATDRWPLFEIRATQLDERRMRLHFSFDYLIADARSFQILFQELLQLYENSDSDPGRLELSFRDYVLAEIALQESELYRRSKQYWLKRLESLPPAPELPLAQTPGTLSHPRFVRRSSRLDRESWLKLKRRATRAGLTPSGALLAAFAEILAVWSKSPRFTIVLTLFNRLPFHPEVNRIVGDFTSTTLAAIESTQATFEARARRIQEQLWEDLDHRYISGVRVLREVGRRQGGPLRAALPVVFTSILTQTDTIRISSEQAAVGEIVFAVSQTPQVWLDHQVYEQDDVLVLNWDAVEDLFPEGLLDDMFEAYCHLLLRLAEEEEVWHERQRQIVPHGQIAQRTAINATDAALPAKLLHTLFGEQAARRPDATAIITCRRGLTYGELDRLSNHIGRKLRQLGARPNSLIAVVMEKGWQQVVAVLAILKSGAAYLPIDASLPPDRIRFLLEDGEVATAIVQTALDDGPGWPSNVLRVCIGEEIPSDMDDEPLDTLQGLEDLAYVIYTSGSTGLPKGVMIDHAGAVNTICDMNQRFAVGPDDRVLAISSLSFDLSVYDIFGILAAGGAIVIPEATGLRDPAHWAELIASERVTIWNSVPALMEMLTSYVATGGERQTESLRLVLMSGDWIPVSLPDRIKAVSKNIHVVSLGGATEASIWSILYPIDKVHPDWKSIPYGRPMLSQRFYVLNESLDPCPVWVPGNLFIGGIGLAKGYWRNEEKTRASFIIHPMTGERIYRTGDLGCYLPDGNIEFLGREDFQVKIQGYRIELGEIEAALSEHPLVSKVIVTALGEMRGSKRLVAYIVPTQGQASSTGDLQSFLRDRLPEYMVPSSFVTMGELPLTSNGKVNRQALPAPEQRNSGPKEAFEMPQTPVELVLAEIYSQTLGINRVSIHDDFFMLGGDSIQAISLAAKVRESFQINLPLRCFFENPTVSGLALALPQVQVEQADSDEMAQILAELEQLSEGDVQRMLSDEMLSNNPGAHDDG